MKNLFKAIVGVLALNFLGVLGFAGWLWRDGRLDRKSVIAIKGILFPAPSLASNATTQPSMESPTTRPSFALEQLLAKRSGSVGPAAQVEQIQQTVDAQMGQLDQRERQLEDLQRLVASAQDKLEHDRQSLESDRQQLVSEQQQATRLASDKGFQESLNLYTSMPAKQAKAMFMAMDDATAAQYLQSMEPRTASRIIKEFRLPEESERVRRMIDRMRQGNSPAATQPAAGEPKIGLAQ